MTANRAYRLRRAAAVSLSALLAIPALGGDELGEVRVELLATGIIPSEHEEFGRIGGISGLCAIWGAHRDPVRFVFVTDAKDVPRALDISVRMEDQISIAIVGELRLGHAGTDCEAIGGFDNCRAQSWCFAYECPPCIGVSFGGSAKRIDLPPELEEQARANQSFEACAIVEDSEIWAGMEAPLNPDGGSDCRVIVIPFSRCLNRTSPARQYIYRLDPAPRGFPGTRSINGLSEFAAMPDGRILALERSASVPRGFGAKFFLLDKTTYDDPQAPFPVLNKTLVADVTKDLGLPVIGNLEAMAVGARMSELTGDEDDKGRLLLLIADDNFGRDGQRGSQWIALRLLIDGG